MDFTVDVTLVGLRLSWEDREDDGVYRIRKMEKGVTVVAAETASHYWVDKDARSGRTVRYAVTRLLPSGEETPLNWQYALYLETPAVSAREVMAGYSLEWEPVEGAEEYEISRRTGAGEWETAGVTRGTAYTDACALPDGDYTYAVTAVKNGYSSLRAKCRTESLPGIPEEIGAAPYGFETFVFGESGSGRDMVAYRWGEGENLLLMTFCIHGWEDAFDADGRAHVYTAFRFMNGIAESDLENWRIIIVPCANPDGLLDGDSHNGAGRCTTFMLDENGGTVSGSVDINRCFPARWDNYTYPRNYNGSAPLACREAVALAGLLENSMGEGENIFVDVHGWTEQTVSEHSWNRLTLAFDRRFWTNEWKNIYYAEGYIATYALELGYEACLFEFPYRHACLETFVESRLPEDFAYCVSRLLN
ncbi:MAG: hypothetical protein IKZ19_07085 [Clostridia bacterium]|nr:hypothetical protein [Clostridia bacterium]